MLQYVALSYFVVPVGAGIFHDLIEGGWEKKSSQVVGNHWTVLKHSMDKKGCTRN